MSAVTVNGPEGPGVVVLAVGVGVLSPAGSRTCCERSARRRREVIGSSVRTRPAPRSFRSLPS
ncbi:MAG: hypothetical protein WC986_14930, partial [Elusimicrobiota bacterium]